MLSVRSGCLPTFEGDRRWRSDEPLVICFRGTYGRDMICQGCQRPGPGLLCGRCMSLLRPAPERILSGGVRLVAAFEHSGPAKTLMHHLKYRGIPGYPSIVAAILAERLPSAPVVPVPRALSRRIRYGVDPTSELARALGARIGAPVLSLLQPPFHTARRAGSDHDRHVDRFPVRGLCPEHVIVIDDVVTTGATLEAAIASLGPDTVALAAAANLVV